MDFSSTLLLATADKVTKTMPSYPAVGALPFAALFRGDGTARTANTIPTLPAGCSFREPGLAVPVTVATPSLYRNDTTSSYAVAVAHTTRRLALFTATSLPSASPTPNTAATPANGNATTPPSHPPAAAAAPTAPVSHPRFRHLQRPRGESFNRHEHFLAQTDCCDKTIYPWIRASSSYPALRRKVVDLQGCDGIHVTGHTLTGINKASELQVTNALKLCHEQFGCLPPWGAYIGTPLLPDCNDEDAFKKASSIFEAIGLAWKSLVGSFLLLGVVSKLGAETFE